MYMYGHLSSMRKGVNVFPADLTWMKWLTAYSCITHVLRANIFCVGAELESITWQSMLAGRIGQGIQHKEPKGPRIQEEEFYNSSQQANTAPRL